MTELVVVVVARACVCVCVVCVCTSRRVWVGRCTDNKIVVHTRACNFGSWVWVVCNCPCARVLSTSATVCVRYKRGVQLRKRCASLHPARGTVGSMLQEAMPCALAQCGTAVAVRVVDASRRYVSVLTRSRASRLCDTASLVVATWHVYILLALHALLWLVASHYNGQHLAWQRPT